MSQPAVRLESVSIGYKDGRGKPSVIAAEIDVELRRGELACLLGPNGAGKSTLLRTIAGLQPPLSGHVSIDGVPLGDLSSRELAKRLAVVLTGRVDVGALSGFAVAALGRHPYTGWAGRLAETDRKIVGEALRHAGAHDLAERPFARMSDGEQQRVLIARALAQQPRLLALDEITAFLDLPRRVGILRLLQRLAREQGVSILLSTHELELAMRCADRIWLLKRGSRLRCGAPEDLAMNGALERCFSTDGVAFDSDSGSFRLRHEAVRTIQLEHEGVATYWTRRMLERIGFETVDGPEAPMCGTLEVVAGSVWRWRRDGRLDEFRRLEDLAQALRGSAQ